MFVACMHTYSDHTILVSNQNGLEQIEQILLLNDRSPRVSILLRIYCHMGIGQPQVEKRDGRFCDLCLSMSVMAFLCILHATLTGTFSTTSCTHALSPVIANAVRHTFASILIWKCLIHVHVLCYFWCFLWLFFSVKHFSVVTFCHFCHITLLMVKHGHPGWTEVW